MWRPRGCCGVSVVFTLHCFTRTHVCGLWRARWRWRWCCCVCVCGGELLSWFYQSCLFSCRSVKEEFSFGFGPSAYFCTCARAHVRACVCKRDSLCHYVIAELTAPSAAHKEDQHQDHLHWFCLFFLCPSSTSYSSFPSAAVVIATTSKPPELIFLKRICINYNSTSCFQVKEDEMRSLKFRRLSGRLSAFILIYCPVWTKMSSYKNLKSSKSPNIQRFLTL